MRLPEDYKDIQEAVMSNYDHAIVPEVVERVKGNPVFAMYPGWNFCGKVWWQEDQWHCDVWVWGSYSETISGTLEEIMKLVCEKYGND